MSHRDPLHLLPEPATTPACESCGFGPRDSRLDGKHICSACYWLRSCKRCRKHFATPADEDGYCAQCFSAWLTRHPDELADMRAHLESTEEGRAVLREVVVGYERASAELEQSRLTVAQGMRRIARESRAQHYREMAEQVREEA